MVNQTGAQKECDGQWVLKAEKKTKVVEVTEVVDDLFVVRVNEVMDDTKKVEDTRLVPS